MKKLACIAALATAGLFGTGAQAAELLTNGSFEAPTNLTADGYCYNGASGVDCGGIAGWSGFYPTIIAANSAPWSAPGTQVGFDASFGTQLAGVQNSATLTQSVNGAGGLYTLSWYDAGRVGDGGQTYQVRFGGSTIGTFGVNSGQGWSLNSFTFTAASGSQLLEFVGVGPQADGTAFIDQVSLTGAAPVPEPESIAMMLAGLGMLGAVARRQRKG
ncbi:MAG: hypothetical protein RLY71_3699 [Pseudomonadota bacterium]